MEIAIAVSAVLVGLAGCFGGRRAEDFVFAFGAVLFSAAWSVHIGKKWLPGAEQLTLLSALLILGTLFLCIKSSVCGATVTGTGVLVLCGSLLSYALQTVPPIALLFTASAFAAGIIAVSAPQATAAVAGAVFLVLGIFELMQPLHGESFLFGLPGLGKVGNFFILWCIAFVALVGKLLRPIFAKLKPDG